MKLLLYETVLQKGSLKCPPIFVVVDYNCEYFLCMVGSCHTYSPELNHLLFRPILEYGNVIWDNCTQNEFNLLESVQVEAGRVIFRLVNKIDSVLLGLNLIAQFCDQL
jgi:hypothetical protein